MLYSQTVRKTMNKFIATLLFSAVLFGTVASTANAAGSNCQAIYGCGEVCNEQVKFTINKLVQKPNKGGEFVENLTASDPRFAPDQNVNFKIVIENTGSREIASLNVVDTFPQFLSFVAGVGNANVGAKQINFVISNFKAGQKVEYVLTAKTGSAGELPANQAITCVTNNVVATASNGATASDNSQLCIEKSIVVPTPEVMAKPFVKNIPSTGPEMGLLLGLAPLGALGVFLKRKAN